MQIFIDFLGSTGFAWMTFPHALMIIIGIVFITLAITKHYEPLLLIPIGMGMIVGNIPYEPGRMALSVYDDGSVLKYLYFGVSQGIFPPLIFLAAAQIGVFLTFSGAIWLGFTGAEAGSIGIIGGADGPTAIFLATQLAPHLLGAIAIAAYSYMALVPVIQHPIMRLLTTREERLIRMAPPRVVSRRERIIFPIVAFLICALIAPASIVLI
jgi:carboxybiotin decarboxylase